MHTYRETYLRKLPHIQPLAGTFFVTYRLYGTLPIDIRRQILEEQDVAKQRLFIAGSATSEAIDELDRRFFARFDTVLNKTTYGATHLSTETIAELTANSLHFWDAKRIDLIAFSIMPNHVHAVFTLLDTPTDKGMTNSLDRFMHSVKSFTAHEANKILKQTGSFWEEKTYDRLVRDRAELYRIVAYVLNNPVKAGLCKDWRDWKWNYVKPEYDEF